MGTLDYHLRELEIAQNKSDPRMVLPDLLDSDQVILDIGCGIGQSLIALDCSDRKCIGIDVDQTAIQYGREKLGEQIEFHCCPAEKMPLEDKSVDLVMSRVALPYTNIPLAVREIKRVLRPGGRVWVTLHSHRMVRRWLAEDLKKMKLKSAVQRVYVLLNGAVFRLTGRVFPYLNGSYESWQNNDAFAKWLKRKGFDVLIDSRSTHRIVIGTLVS